MPINNSTCSTIYHGRWFILYAIWHTYLHNGTHIFRGFPPFGVAIGCVREVKEKKSWDEKWEKYIRNSFWSWNIGYFVHEIFNVSFYTVNRMPSGSMTRWALKKKLEVKREFCDVERVLLLFIEFLKSTTSKSTQINFQGKKRFFSKSQYKHTMLLRVQSWNLDVHKCFSSSYLVNFSFHGP